MSKIPNKFLISQKMAKILFRNFIDEFQALHLPKAFGKASSRNQKIIRLKRMPEWP